MVQERITLLWTVYYKTLIDILQIQEDSILIDGTFQS
jgi:hypothetical protein